MHKNKIMKKALALTLAASSLFSVYSLGNIVSAETTLSVAQITKEMGVGWNVGNSLDSIGGETNWGNPAVTKALIDAVKAKGFNTVRVPITWYEHISGDGSYTIDASWMKRVKEVVDYAYNNDMYVIINVHHENWINRSDFATAGNAMKTQLCAVWNQIATEFSGYGQRLIFEGMNEPRAVGNSDINEWVGNQACYNVVNQLNAAFVDTVRSVESPYRQTRMLMVPDYAASREASIYSYLTIPKASGSIDADNDGDDDYVAVSLHAYSPYNFAMGDGNHSDFSDAYASELEMMFSGMQTAFLQDGTSIVLGEFSASNFGYDDARVKWAETYMKLATEYGIPCVLWDNNVEANNGGEAHGYINRWSNQWYASGEKVVDKLISTRKNTEWGTKTVINYPMFRHNDYSTGSNVNIAGDGVMKVPKLDNFSSGREFAIKYNGTTIPEIALMNSDWGGWTTLTPYDYDKKNDIAYFSYDQIMKTWNASNGTLNYIKLNNKDDIGFGGIVLLTIPDQVKETIVINTQPTDASVIEGDPASFSISATGEGLKYQWQVLSDGNSWKDINGANSDVLFVAAAEKSMDGQKYRCRLTDNNGELISNEAVLYVTSLEDATTGMINAMTLTEKIKYINSLISKDQGDVIILTEAQFIAIKAILDNNLNG